MHRLVTAIKTSTQIIPDHDDPGSVNDCYQFLHEMIDDCYNEISELYIKKS